VDPVGELNARVARLEERIETMKADLTATLESFRTDQAVLREDMAKRDAESAKRDKGNQRWVVGFGIAQIAITIAAIGGGATILGLLIALPS